MCSPLQECRPKKPMGISIYKKEKTKPYPNPQPDRSPPPPHCRTAPPAAEEVVVLPAAAGSVRAPRDGRRRQSLCKPPYLAITVAAAVPLRTAVPGSPRHHHPSARHRAWSPRSSRCCVPRRAAAMPLRSRRAPGRRRRAWIPRPPPSFCAPPHLDPLAAASRCA